MNIFKKYRTLWVAGMIVVLAILFITNFSHVVDGVSLLLRSITSLLGGAALAFILNLIMDPVEKKLHEVKTPWINKNARTLAILTSFLVMFLLIILILSIVIPNLSSAIKMLTDEAPTYINEAEVWIKKLLSRFPEVAQQLDSVKFDWNKTMNLIIGFITKGNSSGDMVDTTFNLVSSVIGSMVNLFVMVIFASYVLSEKERFVKGYYTLTDLFMAPGRRVHLTRNLRIINESFKSFILGEIIDASILSTMCIIGMLILRLPYAMMIGILVGVINMIPMIGAYIGGAIGAFIIFTISPTQCLIFLVFLCVIQQIESNVFFPRVIGNKVGLPGIYVMMTIVIGGSLFGVFGMILGVPLMASLYKIFKDYLAEIRARREKEKKAAETTAPQSDASTVKEPTDTDETAHLLHLQEDR